MIARLQSANDGSSKLEAEMRAWVAVTDREWYRFLLARPELDEVNFWQPSGGRRFSAIQTGEPFLFKLHYPDNAIVGGGTYLWSTTFPLSLTWEAFEQKNGAATIGEMRARVTRYRKPRPGPNEDPAVGCLIIEDPWFLPESDWIPAPLDWRPNIVQGKSYDLGSGIGQRMWEQVLLARQMAWARGAPDRARRADVWGPCSRAPALGTGRIPDARHRCVFEALCGHEGESAARPASCAHPPS